MCMKTSFNSSDATRLEDVLVNEMHAQERVNKEAKTNNVQAVIKTDQSSASSLKSLQPKRWYNILRTNLHFLYFPVMKASHEWILPGIFYYCRDCFIVLRKHRISKRQRQLWIKYKYCASINLNISHQQGE